MIVKASLKLEELQLQISGCQEQRPVETFASYRADQAFDEGMRRQRHIRRLDNLDEKSRRYFRWTDAR